MNAVNNTGKPRLTKFYKPSPAHARVALVQQIFQLIANRPDSVCNFVEIPGGLDLLSPNANVKGKGKATSDTIRVIYRHYATLYFALVVDEAESELGILDLIQVS